MSMGGKYYGEHEYRAKLELLNFLNLLWVLEQKRFSRAVLMRDLEVPYSIARCFSEGKGKNPYHCYKSIHDEPDKAKAIRELVANISQARNVDKLLDKPVVEGDFFKDKRRERWKEE
ncbi:hypothetical protein H5123_09215 [Shewanella sp. SR43-4]|jgi:hypothetical protein|uniref:hypothetical protein n=1 Tax=Shewanella sp. SR43-4 TaxID=2760942 RepID=UPI0018003B59|nr:hypothetical protein [Shewanella sp. SR43-4]MBB1317820.1 hypothetical protein [Shewanella sp. SR43-4]